MTKTAKGLLIGIAALIVAAIGWYSYSLSTPPVVAPTYEGTATLPPVTAEDQSPSPESTDDQAAAAPVEEPGEESSASPETEVVETLPSLPAAVDYDSVGFARQAPFGQWEEAYFQDACEEASLVMVESYFKGYALDEAEMERRLRAVEPWELQRFGETLSIDTESVAIMAREYFGLEAVVSTEVTAEQIKRQLAQGHLIILPLTGQDINNPNFTGAGPLYHMLVVRGYTETDFITNDPGTRVGRGYRYPQQTLINATHDWNDGDIYNGQPMMIIIKGLGNS